MKSLRLEAVASLVKENCNVLDVGTDHAYLPIILSKSGKCQSIIASDVSNNALSYGRANLKKYHITNVKLVLSERPDRYRCSALLAFRSRSVSMYS